MIYDCFIFNNELDILDIRLHELSSVVDKFVLVESTVSHVNRPKPLYFELNKDRFKQFEKKIIHIVIEDTPNVALAWIINDYQFSQIIRGLRKCNPEDLILFGDADEIPRADKVRQWKDKPGKHKLFLERLSYYYLNLCEYTEKPLNGTHMIKYKDLIKLKSVWIAKYSKIDVEIPEGGWHFSYISNASGIEKKIESMTHQEFNNEKYNTPEKIRKAMLDGKDLFNRGYRFKIESITTLPKFVQENSKQFKDFLLSPGSISKNPYISIIKFYLVGKDKARILLRRVRKKYRHFFN